MADTESIAQRTARRSHANKWRWVVAVGFLICVVIGGSVTWLAVSRPEPIIIAFANSMTGPLALVGEEARVATQLYLDEVNRAGGIAGRPVQLQIFDDQSIPAIAGSNVGMILASRAVAVLGHSASNTSIGAGPLYQAGHIAAVAGNASGDDVTRDNPYYFRALSPNSTQAHFLADYIDAVIIGHNTAFMRAPDIDLVTSESSFDRSFRSGFQAAPGGAAAKLFAIDPGEQMDLSAEDAANALAREAEPRIIVLGLATDECAPVLKAIRRRGIRSMIILASSAATDGFVEQFVTEREEHDEPGYFTDNVFAIAPVILDNTDELGQALAARYQARTGKRAGWFASGAQDAARILVAAIGQSHVNSTQPDLRAAREQIRNALTDFDRPANSVPGINGPLYFNDQREMPRPMRYGYFREGRFLSAPLQLVQVEDRDLVDIQHEIEQQHIMQIGEHFYWLQRVVYTGIDITRLNRVDIKEGSFNADFYLWMRYADGDDLPNRIQFSGFSGAFDPGHPLQSSREEGLDYRLWRISGDFKANFDLHDYPFDKQSLRIRLQNRDHPREQIAYVIDSFGMQLDPRGQAASNAGAFRDLQLWHVIAVHPFVDAASVQSTLGRPALFGTANRIEYAGFDTDVTVRRNVIAFIVKTLVPLFLLVLVVFATLFFPQTFAKERTTIPVSSILTSAVLLISISNQLPPLGYTLALEYIFYVFFGLCLMSMVVGLLSEILRNKNLPDHVIRIDRLGRIAYVAIVAITVTLFIWKYSAADDFVTSDTAAAGTPSALMTDPCHCFDADWFT